MSLDLVFRDAADAIFSEFGEDGIYTSPFGLASARRVILHEAFQAVPSGFESQIGEDQTTATFRRADGEEPAHDGSITVGGKTYLVDAVTTRDRYTVTVAIREAP